MHDCSDLYGQASESVHAKPIIFGTLTIFLPYKGQISKLFRSETRGVYITRSQARVSNNTINFSKESFEKHAKGHYIQYKYTIKSKS